jgi:hypothetical protein
MDWLAHCAASRGKVPAGPSCQLVPCDTDYLCREGRTRVAASTTVFVPCWWLCWLRSTGGMQGPHHRLVGYGGVPSPPGSHRTRPADPNSGILDYSLKKLRFRVPSSMPPGVREYPSRNQRPGTHRGTIGSKTFSSLRPGQAKVTVEDADVPDAVCRGQRKTRREPAKSRKPMYWRPDPTGALPIRRAPGKR